MPSFQIVELDAKGNPTPFPAGVFPDGATAQSVLASLQAKFPDKKLQPRPIKDETMDWRAREQRRFAEGVYEPLPWNLPPIKDHFAYRAIKVPKNVAFTANHLEGQLDKQRSVHVNAYLREFYPALSVDERRKLVWDYCGEDVTEGLVITQDKDRIQTIYEQGPHSCMSDDAKEYSSAPHHPSACYAGPDLAIAALYNKSGDIIARCVVWPEKKIYSGAYGDYARLYEALNTEGYVRANSSTQWHGAKLSAYRSEGNDIVCAYLDIASYGDVQTIDGTEYIVLGASENYYLCNTEGIIHVHESSSYDDDY